jgi:pentatricopeptide repeat protein
MLRASLRLVAPRCASTVRVQAYEVTYSNRRNWTINTGPDVHPNWQKLLTVLKPDERWLTKMHRSSLDHPPNIKTHNKIINELGKSGKVYRAHLNHMEAMFEEGDATLKPNTTTYTSMINAYARVGHAVEAEKALRRLLERYETTKDPGT